MSHSLSTWGYAVPLAQRASLAPLFSGISHTYILDGVLEGLIGEARAAENLTYPAAMLLLPTSSISVVTLIVSKPGTWFHESLFSRRCFLPPIAPGLR